MSDTRYAPHVAGSATSADAADSLGDSALARLEAQVYAAIQQRPQTCDDIERSTGLSHQTASARLRGLALRHLIVDSGERRSTRSGRKAIVWCCPSMPQPGQPGYLQSLPVVASINPRVRVAPVEDDAPRDGCLF